MYFIPSFDKLLSFHKSGVKLIPGTVNDISTNWKKSERFGCKRVPGRERIYSLGRFESSDTNCFAVDLNQSDIRRRGDWKSLEYIRELQKGENGNYDFVDGCNDIGDGICVRSFRRLDTGDVSRAIVEVEEKDACFEEYQATANIIGHTRRNFEDYFEELYGMYKEYNVEDEELERLRMEIIEVRQGKIYISSEFTEQQKEMVLAMTVKKQLNQHLGIDVVWISKNLVMARLPVKEFLAQPMSILHGGVNVVIAETCASIGATVNCDFPRFGAVGQEINGNHISSVEVGKGSVIVAMARPIHVGKRSQVWNIEIVDEKTGKLTSWCRMTAAVIALSKL